MGDIGNLEELIQTTIAKVGAIIAKPKMTEKLLSKPPYRFLHDTISAITAATSFGEGLFSGPESDSSTADKHVKMGYLDKIFQLVGICKVSRSCYIFIILCHLLLIVTHREINYK
jgi:TRAF3-interacting protein 1